jgi:hypothetical protein
MVDDCSKAKDQQDFLKGTDQFAAFAKQAYNAPFAEMTGSNRELLLNSFNKKKDYPKEMVTFFNTVKGLTIYGYTTSQYFMTKQIVYELVPGRYNAFYPVSKIKQA